MVEVLKSGFFTTIQDLGRIGFEDIGVPNSGAMDQYSTKLANSFLGNDLNDAVLEITMSGPNLKFNCNTSICITGGDLSPMLNDNKIMLNKAISVFSGDTLSFGRLLNGIRAYLAVSGGFQSEVVMNSRSMFGSITSKTCIAKGDVLQIKESKTQTKSNSVFKTKSTHLKTTIIDVFKGPEFELLSKEQQKLVLSSKFKISKNNSRMAYQLEETLENNLEAIITSLVLPGTVQLTPSGNLIVLMRDCQTTGGYPRVLQLKEFSINVLAQKFTKEVISFNLVSY